MCRFWRSSWPLPVDAPLDAKGVRDLLRHLNMKASKSYVAQCIKEIDRNGDQAMDFGEFVDLTARLLSLSTEEIRTFYSRYNVHSNRDGESGMELSGFQHFLLYEQKEQQSLAEISMLLQPLLAPGEQHLSRSAFERFLLSEGNTVFDPKCDQVYLLAPITQLPPARNKPSNQQAMVLLMVVVISIGVPRYDAAIVQLLHLLVAQHISRRPSTQWRIVGRNVQERLAMGLSLCRMYVSLSCSLHCKVRC